jgi:hypothetical protein
VGNGELITCSSEKGCSLELCADVCAEQGNINEEQHSSKTQTDTAESVRIAMRGRLRETAWN